MARMIGQWAVMDKHSIANDAQQTTLDLRINGIGYGIFTSSNAKHAEEWMVDALYSALGMQQSSLTERENMILQQGLAKDYSEERDDKIVFDVFITRSPCQNCTAILLQFAGALRDLGVQHEKTFRMRLFCATLYKGETNHQSRHDVDQIRADGNLRVYRWDFVKMAQAGDASSINLLELVAGTSMIDRDPNKVQQYHKLDNRALESNADTAFLNYKVGSFYSVD